jgi:hypothetical protein
MGFFASGIFQAIIGKSTFVKKCKFSIDGLFYSFHGIKKSRQSGIYNK